MGSHTIKIKQDMPPCMNAESHKAMHSIPNMHKDTIKNQMFSSFLLMDAIDTLLGDQIVGAICALDLCVQ